MFSVRGYFIIEWSREIKKRRQKQTISTSTCMHKSALRTSMTVWIRFNAVSRLQICVRIRNTVYTTACPVETWVENQQPTFQNLLPSLFEQPIE